MEQNNYDQLYRIGTNGLTIVLALAVSKVSQGIVDATTPEWIKPQSMLYALVTSLTLLTILCSMIGIIVTVNYAHSDLKIPFRPIYLIINLLSVSLPFYLAVNAMSGAIAPIAKNTDFNVELLREGLGALLIGFGSLLFYLIFIYRNDPPEKTMQIVLPKFFYFWVGGFQSAGIVFAVILLHCLYFKDNVGQLVFSALGVVGSAIYLVVTPLLRFQFQKALLKSVAPIPGIDG